MKNSIKISISIPGLLLILALSGCSQSKNSAVNPGITSNSLEIPHLEKQGSATRIVANGKPMLLIAGELHNSTAGGFTSMQNVWKKLAKKNLNTVIATVSWELIEPEQGKFDFSLVDSTIYGARQANLKLVLIWFGSWKNASSVYIPSWVKKDYEKYPRVKDEEGIPLEILSTFGKESADRDAYAFAALMHHIKEVDSSLQTVIMMQVENEVGVLDHLGKTPGNARRDFCPVANEAYNGPVPTKLMEYLISRKDKLFPELLKVWSENGMKNTGSWEEVFGKSKFKPDPKDWKFYSYYTEELFMAWNYASYIEIVSAAGKKEYPIPMYVNAWLKQPFSYWPGRYPSGAPLPQVLDIWRSAAPSIDFIAPDIYTDEFKWTCQEFTRSNNPLFIPEIQGGKHSGPRAFYVFGEYSAGCFSPFAIDNPRNEENDPFHETYGVLEKMSPIILENQGKGTMRGILVDTLNPVQQFILGDFTIEAKLRRDEKTDVAGGIIIQTGKQDFICAGKAIDVLFSIKNDSMRLGVDSVDEGSFENGVWISQRRLNGDEVAASTWSGTGLILPQNMISIQKLSLYRYR
jgi:hypothetical protein